MNHLTTEPIELEPARGPVGHSPVVILSGKDKKNSVSQSSIGSLTGSPKSAAFSPLDQEVGIELRVTRAGMPARRLRINSVRCTFGSGEGCTVRLSDTTLRPLHAVILRDDGRTLIRGYTVPLEINGYFEIESCLKLGDVFRLGQYCFEMIDLPAGAAPAALSCDEPHSRRETESTDAAERDESATAKLSPKRLKFSEPSTAARRRSVAESVAESVGRQSPLVLDQERRHSDDSDGLLREPATSLAQIHVQAKRNSELLSELTATRHREQATQAELVQAIGNYELSQQRVAEAAAAVENLQLEISELTAELASLREAAQSEQTQAAAEQAKLNESIALLRDQIRTRLTLAEAEKDSLNQAIATLRIQGQAQQSRAEAEKTSLSETVASLRDQSAAQEARFAADHATFSGMIASLKETEEASRRSEAASRKALDEAIRQRDEAFSQRAAAIDSEQAIRAKLSAADEQVRRLTTQFDETSALLEQVGCEASQARAAIDELQSLCTQQGLRITELTAVVVETKRCESEAVERLQSDIEQLRQELASTRQQAEDSDLARLQSSTLQTNLDSTLQAHLADKLKWELQLEKLQQTIAHLSTELAASAEELVQSRSESAEIRAKVENIQSHFSQVESDLQLRPSSEQWQEVQAQLIRSQSDLLSTQEQLTQIREEYERALHDRAPAASTPAPNRETFGWRAPTDSLSSSWVNDDQPVSRRDEQPLSEPLAMSDELAMDEGSLTTLTFPAGKSYADGDRASDDIESPQSSQSSPQSDSNSPETLHAPVDNLETDQADPLGWKVSSYGCHAADLVNAPADESLPTAGDSQAWASSAATRWETAASEILETSSSDAYPSFQSPTESAWRESPSSQDVQDESDPVSGFDEHSELASRPAATSNAASTLNTLADEPEDDNPLSTMQLPGGPGNWFAEYLAAEAKKAEVENQQSENSPEDATGSVAALASDPQTMQPFVSGLTTSDSNPFSDSKLLSTQIDDENAPSLARMLIQELDADGGDRQLHDSSAGTTPHSNHDHHADVRRREFDERAFRDAFSSPDEDDLVDPNSDCSRYSAEEVSHPSPNSDFDSPESATKASGDEDEDSVEAYMNQLLRRMGQEPLTPAQAPTKPKQENLQAAAKPKVIKPRRPAPERDIALDEMRELANQSAQSAISTSNQKGLKEQRRLAMMDAIQAGVIITCGLVFFYCGTVSPNLTLVWNTAGVLALGLSTFFLYEMYRKLTSTNQAKKIHSAHQADI